jgi:hypothetical protein
VADVGPQFVTFDTVHVHADHHPVVQFGAAIADRQRQAGNGLAVGSGQAAHSTLADAFAQRGDDFSSLVGMKIVHGGPNPSFGGDGPRSGK